MPTEGLKLTGPQRRLLEHVAANAGRLYGSRRDFPPKVARQDTLWRAMSKGLIDPPRVTDTRTWELTEAGRAALDGVSP